MEEQYKLKFNQDSTGGGGVEKEMTSEQKLESKAKKLAEDLNTLYKQQNLSYKAEAKSNTYRTPSSYSRGAAPFYVTDWYVVTTEEEKK